ncbi:MAG TPA: hypothetical protein VFR94_21380 [Nitrososphaeraceae archaeon]|nr:hypothetical protein [Nitrososphaeraceae archaeon]
MRKKNNDNVVEIDTEIYERLALIGMELGEDNVNDFINDILLYQMKKEQEEETRELDEQETTN